MTRSTPPPQFGLYFFGDYPQQRTAADAYETLLSAARYADESGFSSVWLPERHFHSFGGVFPNPSVLAAAVAAQTSRVRINSGSVVLPLHDPIRVAEEWSVVDNLSHGRVGIGVASGWNSTDFVFFPDRFGGHRELMYTQVEQVRRLWRGQSLTRTAGTGADVEVSLFPRPLQPNVPMYTAVVGRRESFAQAARADLGIVTNLMTQDIDALADNIAYYRRVRAESGLDPASGTVSVLVHTYLHADADTARRQAYEPLTGYMRSSLSLFGQVTNSLGFNVDLGKASEEDLAYLFGRAYDRYCDSRALIGSPESCAAIVSALAEAGVDEIASLVDFGMPSDQLLAGLPQLNRLRRRTAAVEVHAPMSSGQQRMWFLDRLAPGNTSQNEPKAIRLDGPVDHEAFQRAVTALVERHPALRTVYRVVDGEPCQVVLPAEPVAVEVTDHTGQNESEVVTDAIAAESRRVFSLRDGPLFVCRLLRLAEDHHILVLSFHHIAIDAASATVVTRDLSLLYRRELRAAGRPVDGPAGYLPLLPRAVAVGPTGTDDVETGLAHWRDRLSGELPVLRLPADRPRPQQQTFNGRALFLELDGDLTAGLRRLAKSHNATLFMVLLTGLAATLRAVTGQDDLIVGVPVSDRTRAQRDAVGFLINTIALRFDTTGDPDVAELLRRVRGEALDGYEHATVPFETVVAELSPSRDMSRTPVFQVMAEFKTGDAFDLDLSGITATPLDAGRDVAVTDLSLHLTHRDGIVVCHFEYNTDLFDDATITRVGDYFREILTRAVDRPSHRLSTLIELTVADRQYLADRQTGPRTSIPDTTVVGLINERAHAAADTVAIADEEGELTYRELDDAATTLARHLHDHGAAAGDVVATWLPRTADIAVAQLGIMRARAAYLPLDPALGGARVDTILADSRATAVVTTTESARDLPALPDGVTVITLDHLPDTDTGLPEPPRPDDAAYVIYTSGSTGRPKGVVVTHRNLMRLCSWFERRFEFGTDGHAAAVCGQSFDAAVIELWPTLAGGGRVTIAPESVRRDPTELVDWLNRTGCLFTLLPTVLGEAVLALPTDRQPDLAVMMIGGEALRTRPRPGLPYELINAYGPTEATVLVTTHPVTADGPAVIPIGTPIDGTVLHVLDRDGRPSPVGVPGELYIGGDSVADGYLHAPEATTQRFVPDPSSRRRWYRTGDLVRWNNMGQLEYVGRTDDQVKIRGFRVEPGEAAAALRDHPQVSDAIVLTGHRDTEATLVAYVVPTPGVDDGLVRRLHTDVSGRLPDYLVPTEWALIHRLPVNANGKLDRTALPKPRRTSAFDDVPSGSDRIGTPDRLKAPDHLKALDRLKALWSQVLGVDVDEESSFFEAGGHSITAIRLLAGVREELGVEVPIAEFYRDPTLQALRRRVTPTVEAPRNGPVSYQQTGMVDGHTRANTAWNIVVHLDMTGPLDIDALDKATSAVIARHESLRSRFLLTDGEWRQEVMPPPDGRLEPVDLTEASPDELAEASRHVGKETFDIAEGHLVRFRLLHTGKDAWRLIVVVHHAVCDGWAVSVLLADLAAAYRRAVEGADATLPTATQAIDYATWQRELWTESHFDARLEYWRAALRDRVLTTELPIETPAEVPSSASNVPAAFVRMTVPDGLVTGIDRLAAQLGCTPFAIWSAALGVMLANRTGDLRLTLGTPYAARERREHDSVMACLSMVSLLRLDVDPTIGFGRLASNVLTGYAETVDNFAPLRRILNAVRVDRDDTPKVMPIGLVYQSSMNLAQRLSGLDVVVEEQPSDSPRGRTSFFVEPAAGHCRFGVIANGAVHHPSTLRAWLSDWIDVLTRGVEDPDIPVAKLLGDRV
ncbi:amino acid adenylation domain-containing protein/natural product biosynthesis luciferase-like monooxygenase protein [Stackebrandtia endophytica]|uniref:Amino acid adenylation domain-containing protein/natural product biosynthesis luciferase-like monooxygenase protein n=1 Tax=Stackebrandtia endophytica TaxID=1496996 RepID=A0A543AYX3_9ACTN|nr:non-ribosomal peptide synthetase [Stackebrandtia endophytica]TQL77720.1 amino acid adenylation domain-containing protein/natural product biosynthesis luciferase-like monooxygenase protein [Stackebrandtia endophytica]